MVISSLKRRTVSGVAALTVLLGLATPAYAAMSQSFLADSKDVVGQSSVLGTVTLTEDGWNGSFFTKIDVAVSLASGLKFIDTGNHTSFTVNTNLDPSDLTFSQATTTPIGGAFVLSPPSASNTAPPYGSFQYGFNCTNCGSGASGPVAYTSLYFTLTDLDGIALNNFVKNTGSQGGWFFAADVYDRNTGRTGSIASNKVIPAIPEPETYVMLMAGLGLMGFVARRRKQQATS